MLQTHANDVCCKDCNCTCYPMLFPRTIGTAAFMSIAYPIIDSECTASRLSYHLSWIGTVF